MRVVEYVCAAALVTALSATATAQTGAPDPGPPPSPSATAAGVQPASTQASRLGLIQNHWTAAGFVGSNFGTIGGDVRVQDHPNVEFGGQVSYLWRGVVGGEFLANVAPSFKVASAALDGNPQIYSYMANVIGAIPVGSSGQWQPYFSGGYGQILLRATVLTPVTASPTDGVGNTAVATTTSTNHNTGLGANVGGGLMGFAGVFGFRADVRYFHAGDVTPSGTAADQLTQSLLSGLNFWRTNVGLAFRW